MYDDFDDYDDSGARTSDPLTSHEALNDTELKVRIADTVTRLALEAGERGVTINETAAQMPAYKAWSISPIFAPLVRRGVLVRKVLGVAPPSKRWPEGKEIPETRVDPETHHSCVVHYHHAVLAPKKEPGRGSL
jgi:hypothetical protein